MKGRPVACSSLAVVRCPWPNGCCSTPLLFARVVGVWVEHLVAKQSQPRDWESSFSLHIHADLDGELAIDMPAASQSRLVVCLWCNQLNWQDSTDPALFFHPIKPAAQIFHFSIFCFSSGTTSGQFLCSFPCLCYVGWGAATEAYCCAPCSRYR